MDFREAAEHKNLRATVRAIAAKFGPEYYVPRVLNFVAQHSLGLNRSY